MQIIRKPTKIQIANALLSKKRESAYLPNNDILIRGQKTSVEIIVKKKESMMVHNHPVIIKEEYMMIPSIEDIFLAEMYKFNRIDIVYPHSGIVRSYSFKKSGKNKTMRVIGKGVKQYSIFDYSLTAPAFQHN